VQTIYKYQDNAKASFEGRSSSC